MLIIKHSWHWNHIRHQRQNDRANDAANSKSTMRVPMELDWNKWRQSRQDWELPQGHQFLRSCHHQRSNRLVNFHPFFRVDKGHNIRLIELLQCSPCVSFGGIPNSNVAYSSFAITYPTVCPCSTRPWRRDCTWSCCVALYTCRPVWTCSHPSGSWSRLCDFITLSK